ncbi:hypothetical protein [Salibacterium halotolerans]|uniref:hypothetical protein n=1 Tax=Salibacterium halotolerans TaxID=1884432 RepID=UPI00147F8C29|nr:hypothetical protein [Salibacterium halotolerans]
MKICLLRLQNGVVFRVAHHSPLENAQITFPKCCDTAALLFPIFNRIQKLFLLFFSKITYSVAESPVKQKVGSI